MVYSHDQEERISMTMWCLY